MPLLAGLITSLFAALAGFFAQWVTKKVALAAAAIGAFSLLTVGLFLALAVAVSAVQVAAPAGIAAGVWLFVPDNAPLCVATALAWDATLAVYRWNVSNLALATYTT